MCVCVCVNVVCVCVCVCECMHVCMCVCVCGVCVCVCVCVELCMVISKLPLLLIIFSQDLFKRLLHISLNRLWDRQQLCLMFKSNNQQYELH